MEPFDLLEKDTRNFWVPEYHPYTMPMILSGRRTGKTFMRYAYHMSLPGDTPSYLKIHGLYMLDLTPFGAASDSWCWTKAQLTYLRRTPGYSNRVTAETGWILLDHVEAFLNFTPSRLLSAVATPGPTINGHVPDRRCRHLVARAIHRVYKIRS